MLFRNRSEAGRLLAAQLKTYANQPDVLVLGLPRGGIPVAFEVAKALHAPLDIFLVRKLGVPGRSELAMGAIASGGVRILNDGVIRNLQISRDMIEAVAAGEKIELERREKTYRGSKLAHDLSGRRVILVDDGMATGSTMRAAIAGLRQLGPARIVVAVPVGDPAICSEIQQEADDTICAQKPDPFYAVGAFYDDFSQTSDAEVREFLRRADACAVFSEPSSISVS